MTEQNPKQDEDLGAEFRAFGENLKGMLQALWARPERQQLQNEIENGLNELGQTLRQTADEISQSEVGQRVKTGVEDLRERVERGEVESTIREDLGNALRTVNAELQKLAEKLQSPNHPPKEES